MAARLTVGDGQEMLEVASKSSSKCKTVAMGTHHLIGNVALGIAPLPATSREWDSAESLTFVNLKSNTMKNTMQRYYIFYNMQEKWVGKQCNGYTFLT